MKYIKRLVESEGEYGSNDFDPITPDPYGFRKKVDMLKRKKEYMKMDLKVGDIYLCKKTYKGKFEKGEEYELLGIESSYVIMRYYRDGDTPVRFKMSKESFGTTFKVPIKTDNPKTDSGIGAFDEEWGDIPQFIYKVGTGRDFDLDGYVVAEDNESAKEKAIEMEMVSEDMIRHLRVSKLPDKFIDGELRRRKMEAGKTYSIYQHLDRAIGEWKKTKEE